MEDNDNKELCLKNTLVCDIGIIWLLRCLDFLELMDSALLSHVLLIIYLFKNDVTYYLYLMFVVYMIISLLYQERFAFMIT